MGDCQLSIGAGDPVHSAVWSVCAAGGGHITLSRIESSKKHFVKMGMNEGCSIKFGLSKNLDPEALLMTFIIL